MPQLRKAGVITNADADAFRNAAKERGKLAEQQHLDTPYI